MKIATFNINNVNKRLANLLAWIDEARPAIRALIARNEPRIVSICQCRHVDWMLGTLALANFAVRAPGLVPELFELHLEGFAAALSQPSPTFSNDDLLFLPGTRDVSLLPERA